MNQTSSNKCLVLAALSCIAAALAHLGCIIIGPDGYRYMGAGEAMAQMAEKGLWYPTLLTVGIAGILFTWALYGLSGAGVIVRLPLTRLALVIITAIFLIRGASFVALMPFFPDNSLTFWLLSSAICLLMGSLFAIGTVQQWTMLGRHGTR